MTHCNTCEVELQDCTIDNETKEETCVPYNASVSDCDTCGSWQELKTKKKWVGKSLSSTDRTIVSSVNYGGKDFEKNTLKNQFEATQIRKAETNRYKLCYYFNEIQINPTTGMPGSYGYMYMDIEGKLHHDFKNSSWWNTSWGKCRNITINSSKVDDDLTNFPLYIKLDNSTGNFTAQTD